MDKDAMLIRERQHYLERERAWLEEKQALQHDFHESQRLLGIAQAKNREALELVVVGLENAADRLPNGPDRLKVGIAMLVEAKDAFAAVIARNAQECLTSTDDATDRLINHVREQGAKRQWLDAASAANDLVARCLKLFKEEVNR